MMLSRSVHTLVLLVGVLSAPNALLAQELPVELARIRFGENGRAVFLKSVPLDDLEELACSKTENFLRSETAVLFQDVNLPHVRYRNLRIETCSAEFRVVRGGLEIGLTVRIIADEQRPALRNLNVIWNSHQTTHAYNVSADIRLDVELLTAGQVLFSARANRVRASTHYSGLPQIRLSVANRILESREVDPPDAWTRGRVRIAEARIDEIRDERLYFTLVMESR